MSDSAIKEIAETTEVMSDSAIKEIAETTPAEEVIDVAVPYKRKRDGGILNVILAGAGLFSDGYVNQIISTAGVVLGEIYGDDYKNAPAREAVSSIAFAGTVVGQLSFGYIADNFSRSKGLLVATGMIVIFSIASAFSFGANGSVAGLAACLATFRFFLGIGVGGEYSAGSCTAAEGSAELKSGTRNRWFVWFTSTAIDSGLLLACIVPTIILSIAGDNHLQLVWRLSLGIGAIPASCILIFRLRMRDSQRFQENNMKGRIPYLFVLKKYWFKLFVVSTIWFIYDYSAYAFGIFAPTILDEVTEGGLLETFRWNILLNAFYLPGSWCSALICDKIGARWAILGGVTCQTILMFSMGFRYKQLVAKIGAFIIMYGLILTLGEIGGGGPVGLTAAKLPPSAIRGHFYGTCAAIAKVGAFIGTYTFPKLVKRFGGSDSTDGMAAPWVLAGCLNIITLILAFFFLPEVTQDVVEREDANFRRMLAEEGFDVEELLGSKTAPPPNAQPEQGDPQVTNI